jgi:G3E family GTPase
VTTGDTAPVGAAPTLPPLPLSVIGGFLGAGKTTLVNRWLRDAGGNRLAVLVNDFGAVNVDAELIASVAGDVIALTNGCVCCQIGDDFAAALMRVLGMRERFDAVVVEASGVSDPARIAGYGRAVPELALDGVIVLVDASAFDVQAADPLLADTLQRQLESADLIVLNKADIATPRQLAAAHQRLARWVAQTACVETAHAALPLAFLSDACEAGRHDHHPAAAHDPTALFESWHCRPRHCFDAGALRAWLRAVPAGLLRLKGIVQTDALGWSEVQFAGRRGSLRKAAGAPAGGAALVGIGLRGRLPHAALDAAFGTPQPEPARRG